MSPAFLLVEEPSDANVFGWAEVCTDFGAGRACNGFVDCASVFAFLDRLSFFEPHILHESSLHAEKITVWCGLWAGGVIGPYFLRDDQDRQVTMNGHRYRSMITEYFWPQLDDLDLENMWFQQEGATSRTANVTINLFETKFGEPVISRNGRLVCSKATSSLWSMPISKRLLMIEYRT